MGYGPSSVRLRADQPLAPSRRSTGVQRQHDDPPDHYAARVTAITALAALVAVADLGSARRSRPRRRDHPHAGRQAPGRGGAGPGVDHRPPGTWAVMPPHGGVYPCAGDDEWCVVTSPRRRRLAPPARRARRSGLGCWRRPRHDGRAPRAARRHRRAADGMDARERPPREVDGHAPGRRGARGLHAASRRLRGRPPAPGARFLAHVRAAGPGADEDRELAVSLRAHLAAVQQPGARAGEHTREICIGLLGMDADEVDRLIAGGVLEEPVQSADPGQPALPR